MGFGFLFLGYALNLSMFKGFTDVIGFLLMLYALVMLARFNSGFRRAMYLCIPACVLSGVFFVYELGSLIGFFAISSDTHALVNSYYSLSSGVLQLFFASFLLFGIQQIGKETGVPVIEMKAARNRFLSFIYYVLFIFTEMSYEVGSTIGKIAAYAFFPVLIFGFIYHIMNLILIHNCYVWICLEGDEDMERKKSRFSFINKINEKQDELGERLIEQKRQQKAQKAEKKKTNKK